MINMGPTYNRTTIISDVAFVSCRDCLYFFHYFFSKFLTGSFIILLLIMINFIIINLVAENLRAFQRKIVNIMLRWDDALFSALFRLCMREWKGKLILEARILLCVVYLFYSLVFFVHNHIYIYIYYRFCAHYTFSFKH